MYLRSVHAEDSLPVLRQLIHDNPLGVFTTAISSASYPLIQSSHVPFLLDVQDPTSTTEKGILRAHIARANPQAKTIIDHLQTHGNGTHLEQEILVLFTSPVHHYVTPHFYIETKPTTGKVVPTWNYSAAQVYGKARIFHDPKDPATKAFLATQISDLSEFAETSIMRYGSNEERKAWSVSDAPESYIDLLAKAIIGIEITVDRLEGKFKSSQESTAGDREGVIEGFTALGTETGLGMAEVVKRRGELKMQKAQA